MKITPDIFREIAKHLSIASEASAKISQILSALAVEPPQTELPLTGNSGSTTISSLVESAGRRGPGPRIEKRI